MKLKVYDSEEKEWQYQEISFWSFFKFYIISRLLFAMFIGILAFMFVIIIGYI